MCVCDPNTKQSVKVSQVKDLLYILEKVHNIFLLCSNIGDCSEHVNILQGNHTF